MRTPHPEGPCQGKLESEGVLGGLLFRSTLWKEEKNPNHFFSRSNLTCCDNCSVRNFFDISEREDFSTTKPGLHLKTVFKRATNSLGCLITPRSHLSALIPHLCQNRGENKPAPSEAVLLLVLFFHSHILFLPKYLIWFLPSLLYLQLFCYRCLPFVLSLVFSSKPISWVVVMLLLSALCIDVLLVFDRSSLFAFSAAHLEKVYRKQCDREFNLFASCWHILRFIFCIFIQ